MCYFLKTIIFISTLFLIPVPSSASTLWQDTNVGMSPSDVVKLYPDCRSTVRDGNDLLVKGEQITIFKSKFLVVFEFKKSKLFRVGLLSTDMLNKEELQNPLLVYLQVTGELVKRYGQPIKVDRSSVLESESKFFTSNGISVRLNYSKITSSSISIDYISSIGGENAL